MNHLEAVDLIQDVIPNHHGTWADLGAGSGTFTRALAELIGPRGTIYAVERDAQALETLQDLALWPREGARVIPVQADFTKPFEFPGLGEKSLDGILLANALHFVRDAEEVLERLVARLHIGGRVALVEYDGRKPNRWVPYPISMERWDRLAATAGLSQPIVATTRPSAYGGALYASAADRVGNPAPRR
jgi:SAM-dependent methyltransferase